MHIKIKVVCIRERDIQIIKILSEGNIVLTNKRWNMRYTSLLLYRNLIG
jgi:hypothetical protein